MSSLSSQDYRHRPRWARNLSDVARRCERPGCARDASVAFAFQADRQLVWLDHLAAERDTTAVTGALCLEHADRMVVPLGWFLDDRRLARPQLFRIPGSGDATGGTARPRRRSASSTDFDVVASPTLFDLASHEPSTEPGAERPADGGR